MIAIFDLDYTLTRRGTWGRFVWRSVRMRPWLWVPLLAETLRDQIAYKRGKRPRGAVKRSMMRWSLLRRSRSELQAMAEDFARKEVEEGLRPGAVAALDYHRSRGDDILIASAAVDLVAEPIARALGVTHLVCTRMAWDGEHLLEEFATANCYGEAKREAVMNYMSERGWRGRDSVFYTDSRADFPMIGLAGRTIVVDPKPKTRAEASALSLPIQLWADSADGFEAPT